MEGGQSVIGFKVEIVVEPDDVGFHAYCPALKGLHTCGDTEKEALANARIAAIAYLESSMKHHDSIPIGMMIRGNTTCIPHTPPIRAIYHTEDLQVACAT